MRIDRSEPESSDAEQVRQIRSPQTREMASANSLAFRSHLAQKRRKTRKAANALETEE